MSRALTSGVVTEFTAGTVRPFFLFEAVFTSSTLRLWDGLGDLSWNSATWLGNGWFQGISDVQETGETRASALDITLSGVPLALISLILTEATHSSTGRVWVGVFNSSGAIIANPYLLFSGTLSAPRVDDSPDQADVVLTYEDELVWLQRASELRYTNAAQQSLFSGDRGFEYVLGLEEWKGFWGYKEKPPKPKKPKKTKNKSSRK